MRSKLIRSMIAGFLLGSFLVGSLVSHVQLGMDPLSGGTVFATFGAVRKTLDTSSVRDADRIPVGYTKNFPIIDGSRISVTIRGIRSDESLLGFRLQGKSLISYENPVDRGTGDVSDFQAPSRKASEKGIEAAFSVNKELADVPSGFSEASPTPLVDGVIPKLDTFPIESNPYTGWSQWPPSVSVISA